MTQKYGDETVYAPGTVIISASGEISDVKKIVEPVVLNDSETSLLYIDFSSDDFKSGGSSFAQVLNRVGTETPTVTDPEYFVDAFNAVQELIEERKILSGHDISAGGMITTFLEMCFSNSTGGLSLNLEAIGEDDIIKLLFSENPGIIIQVDNEEEILERLLEKGISAYPVGNPVAKRGIYLSHGDKEYTFDINALRDLWFNTSYLFDKRQCVPELALEKKKNYYRQIRSYDLKNFEGTLSSLGLKHGRKNQSGIKAAIIREKGVNGDREMAYAMHLAGFDVKDVHMTDLISGRETLDDIRFIVFVGGFSNSDVLGSAKGWAGAFRYNDKARITLERFYARKDTLSLGVCNGCQLMAELNLINPEHSEQPKLVHNASGKFESNFLTVKIAENNSVMLKSLAGMKMGIWVAHGEGKFELPMDESDYHIPVKYNQGTYPANPNGSDFDTAALCSKDGRHLAIMPHLERAYMPWQCAFYPEHRKDDEVTPWIEAFVNARRWIENFSS